MCLQERFAEMLRRKIAEVPALRNRRAPTTVAERQSLTRALQKHAPAIRVGDFFSYPCPSPGCERVISTAPLDIPLFHQFLCDAISALHEPVDAPRFNEDIGTDYFSPLFVDT